MRNFNRWSFRAEVTLSQAATVVATAPRSARGTALRSDAALGAADVPKGGHTDFGLDRCDEYAA
jgi:hypothetical protein